MSSIINLSEFTFTVEQVRDIADMLFDEIILAPEFQQFHTVYPGIVYDKEVGFIGEGGLVGIEDQGCDQTPQDWAIATRKIIWQPKGWEIFIKRCYTELEPYCSTYSLKYGVAIEDFTSTDYMNIVTDMLQTAISKFIWRLFWFNDTAAALTPAGVITAGTDLRYFTIIDGFWKQMLTQATTNASQRISIAENLGTTYATQKLDPANVQQYLFDLVAEANPILAAQTNGMIMCTLSVYNAYKMSLQGKGGSCCLPVLYDNMVNGVPVLNFNGIRIMPIPVWDEIIKAYEDNGTKLNNPHRIVYTTKSVLAVGVDDFNSFSNVDVWYSKDDSNVKIKAKGKADAKLANPDLFQIAI